MGYSQLQHKAGALYGTSNMLYLPMGGAADRVDLANQQSHLTAGWTYILCPLLATAAKALTNILT